MPASSAKRLTLLHKLAMLMQCPEDLQNSLDSALELLSRELGMMRGAITLISPKTGKIRIEASYGLNQAQRNLGSYSPGEGITGRVIAEGQPMCIADVSKEPLFLNRTQSRDLSREQISFLCVPISLGGQVVGALSVDQLVTEKSVLQNELRLLQIIAALLAQAAHESQSRMTDSQQGSTRPSGFIGSSDAMRQVYGQIAIVAPSPTTVLLQGESGTGKELAAHAIHGASGRSHGPFISLNCAALPENLIESELFGHERGAFTGATQMRKGRFELAHGGTLFLDEIGELSPFVQAKLLRVIQDRTFERLGGIHTLRSDVRLITATNKDLAKMVEAGSFRRDLFYRLNVFPIYLPPLRQRVEDILPLAAHFLEKFSAGRKNLRISMSAMRVLEQYDWPGNIRELQNVMERAALLTGRDNVVLPVHLSISSAEESGKEPVNWIPASPGLETHLANLERNYLESALEATHGNIKLAARNLGITQRVMGLRMKRHNLDYRRFRRTCE